ncbi:hypothetical protein FP803_05065 [Candidatus Woesearchaeota archaeon]|nr:hypothetical protein [Candidatus Woesearchaeota archaeon]MBU3941767.1 hypothetical protein [Nanoarchaeota archaeon]
MVSITLSVPESVKDQMKKFPEINWSGFIRVSIEAKAKQLSWKEEMLNKLKQEDESGFTEWCIEMGRKVNKGIAERLRKEKLL